MRLIDEIYGESTPVNVRKFTLPISPNYVAHWGLWEAVREIYQNALDVHTVYPSCKAEMEFDGMNISISTTEGTLTPQTLVLGESTKRGDSTQRGKFGEGYKLALLVLARLGYYTEVITGKELWTARIEKDDNFNTDVLNIYVQDVSPQNHQGVLFNILNVPAEEWIEISGNIRPEIERDAEIDFILEEIEQKGRVYVGGLYVTTMKDFACGYSFRTGQINLDRDRGMMSSFDLSYLTSKLWTERGGLRALELIESEAPDVRYVESHQVNTSPLTSYVISHFLEKYGAHAVPVCTEEEVKEAQKAGVKWVLVKSTVMSLLRSVGRFILPRRETPLDQLKVWRERYKGLLSRDRVAEESLDEIVERFEEVM